MHPSDPRRKRLPTIQKEDKKASPLSRAGGEAGMTDQQRLQASRPASRRLSLTLHPSWLSHDRADVGIFCTMPLKHAERAEPRRGEKMCATKCDPALTARTVRGRKGPKLASGGARLVVHPRPPTSAAGEASVEEASAAPSLIPVLRSAEYLFRVGRQGIASGQRQNETCNKTVAIH